MEIVVFYSKSWRLLVLKPLCPETYSFETALQKCLLFSLYLPLEATLIVFKSLYLHNIQQSPVFIKYLYQNTLNEVLQTSEQSFLF